MTYGLGQSAGMGVHVCKSVCIEEKISGREVADYVASKERNATPNSCDQQPSVHLFSPQYTRTYIHEPPFPHSGEEAGQTGVYNSEAGGPQAMDTMTASIKSAENRLRRNKLPQLRTGMEA